jgi:hypothetical protein
VLAFFETILRKETTALLRPTSSMPLLHSQSPSRRCRRLKRKGRGVRLEQYVDVEFDGDTLPADPEEARHWLVRRAGAVATALRAVADELSLGIDVGSWPVKRSIGELPRGVRATISCSAVRRSDCRQIAERLLELASQWRQIIRHLPRMREAA